jgi:hypothetical protein
MANLCDPAYQNGGIRDFKKSYNISKSLKYAVPRKWAVWSE